MLRDSEAARRDKALMQFADTLVITLVLVMWAVSVAWFCRHWRRFSLLGRQVPDHYRHRPPKNVDRVTVVPRPDDSVIYRSYPQRVLSTIQVYHHARLSVSVYSRQ